MDYKESIDKINKQYEEELNEITKKAQQELNYFMIAFAAGLVTLVCFFTWMYFFDKQEKEQVEAVCKTKTECSVEWIDCQFALCHYTDVVCANKGKAKVETICNK